MIGNAPHEEELSTPIIFFKVSFYWVQEEEHGF